MPSIALRSTLTRTALLVGASATIAFAAGCGSSDSSDSSSGGSGGGSSSQITATAGKDIFAAASCSSCHTLADAGAKGNIGPNLDEEKPPVDEIVSKVTNGDGRMPSFKDRLTTEQIQAVADYVASVEGK
ncbi:MAG: cytochrome c [Solirubrobacteraceae bacterium]|nr:cytochrome c [Solirubrobacteraceae bacterium]